MENNPVIYYESKSRALLYGSLVFITLGVAVISELFSSQYDPNYFSSLLMFLIPFLIAFGVFVYLYPISRIEIYSDRFTYRKGRLKFSSNWSEVDAIAFQTTRNGGPGQTIPTAFLVASKNGTTKLIETKILKSKKNGKLVDLASFVDELESISGKIVKWGETSTGKYSEVGFKDYLRGN